MTTTTTTHLLARPHRWSSSDRQSGGTMPGEARGNIHRLSASAAASPKTPSSPCGRLQSRNRLTCDEVPLASAQRRHCRGPTQGCLPPLQIMRSLVINELGQREGGGAGRFGVDPRATAVPVQQDRLGFGRVWTGLDGFRLPRSFDAFDIAYIEYSVAIQPTTIADRRPLPLAVGHQE